MLQNHYGLNVYKMLNCYIDIIINNDKVTCYMGGY